MSTIKVYSLKGALILSMTVSACMVEHELSELGDHPGLSSTVLETLRVHVTSNYFVCCLENSLERNVLPQFSS